MGVLSRLTYLVRSKLNALVSRAEDPSQTLDYSYEQMRDELQQVKAGIADLTTQKKRLELQRNRLEENVEKHNEQAREAVRQGREDLARRALEKKQAKMQQIGELENQIADLQNTQDTLVRKKDELQQRIEEFKTKKETMKAQYEAAEASARVGEALTGAGDEMADVNRAIERAQSRTEEMEARAAAMDELQGEGVLESVASDEDAIDRELAEGRTDRKVEAELETLQTEIEGGSGGDGGEDITADVDETQVDKELEEIQQEEGAQ